jgi:drug/metabolite transporter (DMT)-like permease
LAVAWVVLSERPTGWQLLGAAFIMGGLLLSRTMAVRTRAAVVASPSPSSVRS